MEGRKKALIIGVSQYDDQKHLASLDFCQNDGEAMNSVLIDQEYSIENKLVGHVNHNEFKKAVIDFFRKDVDPSDTLLFYLTGHGFTDEYGEGFFCTSNINIREPDENGFPFNELTKQMDKSESQSIVAILDCCHAGATLQANKWQAMGPSAKEAKAVKEGRASLEKEFKQGQGRCVLASSLSNKESFGMLDKQFSAFTYFVIEGLKPNKNTVDEKGCVTPDKLSLYVSEELKKLQGAKYQKPIRHLSLVDKLVLANHPDLASESHRDTIQTQLVNLLTDGKINEFNKLREKNPELKISFDDLELKEKNLKGINLRNVNLRDARLYRLNLEEADLGYANSKGAYFKEVNLSDANLQLARLSHTHFDNSDLSRADLRHTHLHGSSLSDLILIEANLAHAQAVGADFIRANLSETFLEGTLLSDAKLFEANLSGAYLFSTSLIDAILAYANLSNSILSGTNLGQADLRHANLSNAVLEETNLENADLSDANLSHTYIKDCSFRDANLTNANFTNAILSNVNLTDAITDGCIGLKNKVKKSKPLL